MFGRGRGGGGGGGRQVCQFFLQGRCKFGGTLEFMFDNTEHTLTFFQTTAKMSTLLDKALRNRKAGLGTVSRL